MARRRGAEEAREGGAVAVIVAILLAVFLMFAALVIDLGYWYDVRRQLQTAADGAALAGCWEVIRSGDRVAALATAREYAVRNAVAPGDGLEMIEPGVNSPTTGQAYTEVTDGYVKVTVRKRAPAFFSVVMGYDGRWIMAQSRADAQWITGMRGIVPWSIPIIAAPTRVTVRVGGGAEQTLSKDPDGVWRGSATVGVAPSSVGYPLEFTVYNSRNVPTSLGDAVGVVVREPTAPFADVWLDRYVVQSGDTGGVDVHVSSTQRPTGGRFNGRALNQNDFVSVGADQWRAHLESPSTDELAVSFPLDLEFGQGSEKYQLTNAAYVTVRRSTYPMKDVYAGPHAVAGASAVIDVELTLNDYEYGKLYELKVTSGAEVGNFCAVDLGEIFHPPAFGNPDTPEYDLRSDPGYSTPSYYHYLGAEFPFDLHLYDILWTHTGNLSGPQTASALEARFAGDTWTWDSWKGTKPPTKRLVYVPVVEKADGTSGHSPLVVVGITSFFVDPSSDFRDTIRGFFVEYVAGGLGTPAPPPSGWGIQTPRLVPTGLDF